MRPIRPVALINKWIIGRVIVSVALKEGMILRGHLLAVDPSTHGGLGNVILKLNHGWAIIRGPAIMWICREKEEDKNDFRAIRASRPFTRPLPWAPCSS